MLHITHTRANSHTAVHTAACHLILGKSYEHQSIDVTSLFWYDYHKTAICLGISFRLHKIKMSRGHEEGGDNSAIYHSHHQAHKELEVSWPDHKVLRCFRIHSLYFLIDRQIKSATEQKKKLKLWHYIILGVSITTAQLSHCNAFFYLKYGVKSWVCLSNWSWNYKVGVV